MSIISGWNAALMMRKFVLVLPFHVAAFHGVSIVDDFCKLPTAHEVATASTHARSAIIIDHLGSLFSSFDAFRSSTTANLSRSSNVRSANGSGEGIPFSFWASPSDF
jgi:hypothetical protein